MKNLPFLALILVLSGCVEYQWVKQGATRQQEEIAETGCNAQALRELPPDNTISEKYTSKDKKYDTKDTDYTMDDANDDKREILIKDCMYSKGWVQVRVGN